MDRSRRQGTQRAPSDPPAASRLTDRAKPNRRRAPTTPLWRRLLLPEVVANACGRLLRRSLPALSGLAVIGASGGTAWAGERFVTTSARFAISAIEVRGNHHVTADQVRAALPVAIGDNVFAATVDSLPRELRTNPWVASADALRILPRSHVSEVGEHVPAAVADRGGLFLGDAYGRPFMHAELDETAGLPIITGLDRPAFV